MDSTRQVDTSEKSQPFGAAVDVNAPNSTDSTRNADTSANAQPIGAAVEIGTPKSFETFLLAEYNNTAQAFFNAGAVITQFFQYYLLALAVPITAAGVVMKVSVGTLDLWWLMNSGIAPVLAAFFFAVGCVGYFVAVYIINLRLDALLYARTVNGVRKYFYDLAALTKERESLIRGLPKAIAEPPYYEPRFFLPVIFAFAFLNTFYFVLAMLLVGLSSVWLLLPASLFFVLHLLSYAGLVRFRNKRYLQHD